MAIVAVFYAAFGYLALLTAILWGMLFVGDGAQGSLMDAPATASPLEAILVDLGGLLLLAFLHRGVGRGMLRHITRSSIPPGLARGTRAWAAALALVSIYGGWRSVPLIFWQAGGSLQWAFSGLFYVAWTLILIGAFLPRHASGKTTLMDAFNQPLYGGILLAMWTTSVMSVGHLLLAATVTVYLLFDGISAVRAARAGRQPTHAASLQGKRVAGQRMIRPEGCRE